MLNKTNIFSIKFTPNIIYKWFLIGGKFYLKAFNWVLNNKLNVFIINFFYNILKLF